MIAGMFLWQFTTGLLSLTPSQGDVSGIFPAQGQCRLRTYTINRGKLDEFAAGWRQFVYPLRIRQGFSIPAAWLAPDQKQFMWILCLSGTEDWEARDRAYYASEERKRFDPEPGDLVARAEQVIISPVPVSGPVGRLNLLGIFGLTPGPYAVGFRSQRVPDTSRSWPSVGDPTGRCGRPVQLSIWYPALSAPGEPLTIADYTLADWTGSDDPSKWQTARDRAMLAARSRFNEGLEQPLSEEQWARALATTGTARRLAPPASGRWPLVLFETGLNGRSDFYVHYAEFLASHGYAVASLGSFGRSEAEPLAFDLGGVQQQVTDMEVALRVLASEPTFDNTRMALVGWSVGGVSQALLRLRRPEAFGAAISLDSGTAYEYGAKLLAEAGVLVDARLTVPFMELVAAREGRFQVPRDQTFYERHDKAPSLRVELTDTRHGDLVLPYGVGRLAALAAAGDEGARQGNRAAALYMLNFLEAHVRGRSDAITFLESQPSALSGVVVRDRRGPRKGE